MSSRFVGNRLFFYKWAEGKPGEVVVEGLEIRLDGSRVDEVHMEFHEVEQMPNESDLDFAMRTLLDPRNPMPCTDHAILDRRLEVRDGRLTYQRDAG